MKPKKSIGTNSPKVELTFCERSKGRIHIGLKSVKVRMFLKEQMS